jgi:hypothetical protein
MIDVYYFVTAINILIVIVPHKYDNGKLVGALGITKYCFVINSCRKYI